jgi:hypothetical protein
MTARLRSGRRSPINCCLFNCKRLRDFSEKVSMDDERIQPLLKAAARFDRARHGFSPIPKFGDVDFESRPGNGYDAMLHIY